MGRRSLGARLYYDARRNHWIIRDAENFIRTGTPDKAEAEVVLLRYKNNQFVSEREALKRRNFVGRVYFVTAAHPSYPIKIGYTERIGALRLRSLQNACPYPLYMIGHIPGTTGDERRLHHLFDHLRLLGEWFRPDKELLDHITTVCQTSVLVAA